MTDKFYYQGFSFPTTTPVPDDLFDVLMPELTEGELRVLLYIIRRTFGFKKTSDDISLNQMINGIKTKDGRVLDRGAGMAKSAVVRSVKGLVGKGIITTKRNSSPEKGDEPTTYALRFADNIEKTEFSKRTGGGSPKEPPLVLQKNPQQTVLQQTVLQQQETTAQPGHHSGEPAVSSNVVVALGKKGIGRKMAQEMASRHSEGYLLRYIDYLEYLQATDPEKVKKPSGWLRTAIEKGYGLPDGYTTDWRDRQTAAKQQVEARQEAIEASQREREEEAQHHQETALQRRQAALQTYQPLPQLTELWEGITTQIEARSHDLKSKLLAECLLVQVDGTTATIWTPNNFMAQQLEQAFSVPIRKQLARHLKANLLEVTVTFVTSNSD